MPRPDTGRRRGRPRRAAVAVGWALAAARLAAGPAARADDPLRPLLDHVRVHRDGRAPWSIDIGALDGDRSPLPIGVFDSGVGGLTVMEAILALDAFDNRSLRPGGDGVPDFAGESFVYVGDQANMPYGNYPARGATACLRELIVKDAIFLLGRRRNGPDGPRYDKRPAKAIVIACNTATAYGIDDIRAALRDWNLDIPVIGVVEAGARAVGERLSKRSGGGAVAVLATAATFRSGVYPTAIGRMCGMAGRPPPAIRQHGSIGLAAAIEGQPAYVWRNAGERPTPYLGPAVSSPDAPIAPELLPAYGFDPSGVRGDMARPETIELNLVANYVRYDSLSLVEAYRRDGGGPPIALVVLGCTHFPIVAGEFAEAFRRLRAFSDPSGHRPYAGLIAEDVEFIDPADHTARELFRELARRRCRADREAVAAPRIEAAFISAPNPAAPGVRLAADGSFDPDYKHGRRPGRFEAEDVLHVPLAEAARQAGLLDGLAGALPRVGSALGLPAAKP